MRDYVARSAILVDTRSRHFKLSVLACEVGKYRGFEAEKDRATARAERKAVRRTDVLLNTYQPPCRECLLKYHRSVDIPHVQHGGLMVHSRQGSDDMMRGLSQPWQNTQPEVSDCTVERVALVMPAYKTSRLECRDQPADDCAIDVENSGEVRR